MIKIYGIIRSRAHRCVWAAEEAGLPYELVPIDFSKGDNKKPEFLNINPNGRVPAMVDGDYVLFESFAINNYIVKKAESALAPKDLHEDGKIQQWSLWAVTEMETHAFKILQHTLFLPEDKRDSKVLEDARIALEKPLKILNDALAKNGHLIGDRFTIADLNVACIFLFMRSEKQLIGNYPHVAQFFANATARPAFKTVFSKV